MLFLILGVIISFVLIFIGVLIYRLIESIKYDNEMKFIDKWESELNDIFKNMD